MRLSMYISVFSGVNGEASELPGTNPKRCDAVDGCATREFQAKSSSFYQRMGKIFQSAKLLIFFGSSEFRVGQKGTAQGSLRIHTLFSDFTVAVVLQSRLDINNFFLAAVRGRARRQSGFAIKIPSRLKSAYNPSRLLSRPLLSLKGKPMIHAFEQQWPWAMSDHSTRFALEPEKAHRQRNFISELFCDVNALSPNQDSACGASSTEYLLCWLRYSGTTSFIFFTMDMSS